MPIVVSACCLFQPRVNIELTFSGISGMVSAQATHSVFGSEPNCFISSLMCMCAKRMTPRRYVFAKGTSFDPGDLAAVMIRRDPESVNYDRGGGQPIQWSKKP